MSYSIDNKLPNVIIYVAIYEKSSKVYKFLVQPAASLVDRI